MVLGSPKQRNVMAGVSLSQAWEWAKTTLRDAVKKRLPTDAPKPGKFRLPESAGGTGEAAPAEADQAGKAEGA